MLTLEGIACRRKEFVLHADGSVEGPGIVAVIGPSGSGKSTLMSLIAGFVLPDEGRLYWNGTDLTELAPGERPVAVLFQDNNLFPHLDAATNVALGASPRARPSPAARERAEEALLAVGLDGMGARMPGELSGGQQSRVALARALLTDRPLVLMDEAFSALGPALRLEMLTLVRSLLADKTVLMVTHDPEDARRVSRQTIFVEDGQLRPAEDTGELFANPHDALARYLA
ncbi:MAG: ATP-binding cassette domain-containing protein [Boseongicola sp. SB0676_bin_33]|nr:ATP-binding cassette domain-containing protein [Boseongicola sp. SB0676_bin_33]